MAELVAGLSLNLLSSCSSCSIISASPFAGEGGVTRAVRDKGTRALPVPGFLPDCQRKSGVDLTVRAHFKTALYRIKLGEVR